MSGTGQGSMRLVAAAVLAIAAIGTAIVRVAAEPLAKEACEALVAELRTLTTAGAKDNFAKGAAWGKANLPGDRLKQVGRYIEVEEQLNFRCGFARVRFSLPADEETPGTPEEPKAAPAPKPAPKTKVKSKTGAEPAAAPDAARSKPAPKVQAKIKPPPKPAADEPEPEKE